MTFRETHQSNDGNDDQKSGLNRTKNVERRKNQKMSSQGWGYGRQGQAAETSYTPPDPETGRRKDKVDENESATSEQRRLLSFNNNVYASYHDISQELPPSPASGKVLLTRESRHPMRSPKQIGNGFGGTKEYAEEYLRKTDEEVQGSVPGDARREMNKFRSKYNQYTRDDAKGKFMYKDRDGEESTPYQKAADEEPVGYEIDKEYRRRERAKYDDK